MIISFKNVRDGDNFMFEGDLYVKTSSDRGLTLAGSRVFSPDEIVTQ